MGLVNIPSDFGKSKFNLKETMTKTTIADLGTAFVIFQSVLEVLDDESRTRLDKIRGDRFDKFKSLAEEIDKKLETEVELITANCETFCRMALDGMFDMLEEHFPVEENASE